MPGTILLAGCGKMGGAMLAGWIARGISPSDVYIVEPNVDTAKKLAADYGVRTGLSALQLPADLVPNVIIFAVKPQMMDDAAPGYARFVTPDTVFLSIAAGKPIAYFENILGPDAAIVRSMPNTPAAVGRGVTVACANSLVTESQRQICHTLLTSVSEVAWTDNEDHIDVVTALSGGGPAYVFLLAECLAIAGVEAGLPEEMSKTLARLTVAGSGELLHQSPESPEVLRQNVTSPGGTTAEALKVLMADDGWQPLINRAIAAATKRSRELAGKS